MCVCVCVCVCVYIYIYMSLCVSLSLFVYFAYIKSTMKIFLPSVKIGCRYVRACNRVVIEGPKHPTKKEKT